MATITSVLVIISIAFLWIILSADLAGPKYWFGYNAFSHMVVSNTDTWCIESQIKSNLVYGKPIMICLLCIWLFQIEEKGQKIKKVYDLNVSDFFWAANAALPFPQMAGMTVFHVQKFHNDLFLGNVDEELNKYKKEVEEVTGRCGVSSLEEIDAKYIEAKLLNLQLLLATYRRVRKI